MANKIQFKRGIKATLPVLSVGEPALCTDTGEVFIGGSSGNIGIAKASDLTDKASKSSHETITGIYTFAGGRGNNEGGEVHLAKPVQGTSLTADMAIDVVDSSIRFFAVTTNGVKGASIDLSQLNNIEKILTQKDYTTLQTGIDGCFKPSNYGVYGYAGTPITLSLANANSIIGTSSNITIPNHSSVPLPYNTQITVVNWSGTTTFLPSEGVAIYSKDNKRTIDGSYASATLIKVDANAWYLIGALK